MKGSCKLKVGLLLCDEMASEFRSEFLSYASLFEKLFAQYHLEWVVFDVPQGQLPRKVDDCDFYLTTGSKHSVYDDLPWIKKLCDFILVCKASNVPFVGICFGHQAIAKAIGAEVGPSSKGWGIGISENEISCPKSWMLPHHTTLNLFVSHQDQVYDLPTDVKVWAKSSFCPNFGLRIGSLMGVQGHPEFVAEYAQRLWQSRKENIPAEVCSKAEESLALPLDSQIFASWVIEFAQQILRQNVLV